MAAHHFRQLGDRLFELALERRGVALDVDAHNIHGRDNCVYSDRLLAPLCYGAVTAGLIHTGGGVRSAAAVMRRTDFSASRAIVLRFALMS